MWMFTVLLIRESVYNLNIGLWIVRQVAIRFDPIHDS